MLFRSTLPEQAETFREEVIYPRQRLLEHPLNLLFDELGITDWRCQMPTQDSTQQLANAKIAQAYVATQSVKRDELRALLELEPLGKDKGGEDVIAPQAPGAGGAGGLAAMLGGGGGKAATQEGIAASLRTLEERLAKALQSK